MGWLLTRISSVFGPGYAERFTARLGIGRRVPCFVFFTDVGDLSVDVFPVGKLSADETYRQLRIWIDRFYEENRATVDKWNQVEKDIATFTKSVGQSLATLRRWVRDGDDLWRDLRSTAELIVQLSSALPEPEMYESVIAGLNPSSWECRRILSKCQSRLKELHAKKDKHERFEVIINKLEAASDLDQIYKALSFAKQEPLTPRKFMDSNGVLCRAMNMIGVRLKMQNAQDPETELFIWWRQVKESLPSRNQFQRVRSTWSFVTKRYRKVSHSEYVAFVDTIFALPFSDTSEAMTEKSKRSLAKIVGIDPMSSEWSIAFSVYSDHLTPFFNQLCNNTPLWIRAEASNLKVSDVILFRRRKPVDFKKILTAIKEDDPLRRIIQKVANEWPNRQAKRVAESEKVALQCRDEVLAAFSELQEEPFDLSTKTAVVYSACLRDIRAVRDRIEEKLIELVNLSSNPDLLPSATCHLHERMTNAIIFSPYFAVFS